jgi:hypothetical protein
MQGPLGASLSLALVFYDCVPSWHAKREDNMKEIIIIVLLCIVDSALFSQDIMIYKRIKNETADEYVNRVKPQDAKIIYKTFETSEWDKKEKSIITFYNFPQDKKNINDVYGRLYLRQDDVDYYRDISIGDFQGESDIPEILDTAFYNVDKDSEKEFIVLYRYWMMHYDATGYAYSASFFDNPNVLSDSLEPIEKLNELFLGFDSVISDEKAKYKDMNSIIKELKKMGYK